MSLVMSIYVVERSLGNLGRRLENGLAFLSERLMEN